MADRSEAGASTVSTFQRAFVASAAAALVVGLSLTIWHGSQILLLAFAGMLLALLLRTPADWLHRRIRIPPRLALLIEVVIVLGLLVLFGWLTAPSISEQFVTLRQEIPRSIDRVREQLRHTGVGRAIEGVLPAGSEVPWARLAGQAAGMLSTVAGVLFASVVFLVVGLFLAINPHIYRENGLLLVPRQRRDWARSTLAEMGDTLRAWLMARLAGMAFIGVSTAIGLWALGLPLALSLGVLAALLAFIPNFGPILSVVPALLLALTQGWTQVALVAGLYVVLQAIDNNVVTPLIEQRMVHLPPAFTGLMQILLGLIFGILGLFLATPLTACMVILVRRIYVEDTLGERRSTEPS